MLAGKGCVPECPATLIPWGVKANGRECREPFVCRLAEGCECVTPAGCADCNITTVGSTCLACKSNRFAVGGQCPKEAICKGGKVRPRSVAVGRPTPILLLLPTERVNMLGVCYLFIVADTACHVEIVVNCVVHVPPLCRVGCVSCLKTASSCCHTTSQIV